MSALGWRVHDQKRPGPAGERPADEHEPFLGERVHELRVLAPGFLLAEGFRGIPARPGLADDGKGAHGSKGLLNTPNKVGYSEKPIVVNSVVADSADERS